MTGLFLLVKYPYGLSLLLQKLKVGLPNDPVVPLLDVYPKELRSGSQRDISAPVLTADCSQWPRGRDNPGAHGQTDG